MRASGEGGVQIALGHQASVPFVGLIIHVTDFALPQAVGRFPGRRSRQDCLDGDVGHSFNLVRLRKTVPQSLSRIDSLDNKQRYACCTYSVTTSSCTTLLVDSQVHGR